MPPSRSPGISGLALGVAVAGGIVLYAGYKNASITDTLKGILKGQPPTGSPQTTSLGTYLGSVAASAAAAGAAAGGTQTATQAGGLGNAIADTANNYLGIKYVFGGATPKGFDCSGLVTYVLHHDLGINLPSNSHTVTGQFYVWGGATTLSGKGAALRGDLVCWPSHIGIYVGNGKMINAPHTGAVVRIDNVWGSPAPIYRRVLGADSTPIQGFGAK